VDGPSVPLAIVRQWRGIVGRIGLSCGILFELLEESVQVLAVEDDASTLAHGHELWAPDLIERAALDANVAHGLLVVQAALGGHIRPFSLASHSVMKIPVILTPTKSRSSV